MHRAQLILVNKNGYFVESRIRFFSHNHIGIDWLELNILDCLQPKSLQIVCKKNLAKLGVATQRWVCKCTPVDS